MSGSYTGSTAAQGRTTSVVRRARSRSCPVGDFLQPAVFIK